MVEPGKEVPSEENQLSLTLDWKSIPKLKLTNLVLTYKAYSINHFETSKNIFS